MDLAPNDEVALYVANHTSANNLNFQRGRIVVNGVSGIGPQGEQGLEGPQGPEGPAGPTQGFLFNTNIQSTDS